MAKGLFAVYRDDAAPAGPSSVLGRSVALPPNKAHARRKDGLAHAGAGLRVPRLGEKENVDPLGARLGGKGPLGKGKKPALAAKKRVDEPLCGGGKGVRLPPPRGLAGKGATNAICTGTLRTRVLPDLPPLEAEEPAMEHVALAVRSTPAPRVVDLVLDNEPSPRTSGEGSALSASTGSASDSGYARSLSGRASDTDLDVELAAAFMDEDTSAELDLVNDREADRRARAMTESPLAEITQAFTGLGNFSVAHMSPTPSHVRPSASHSRPAPPARTRSSPCKSAPLSAIPTRTAPYAYSTTATTKRAKPSLASGENKPRAGGSLRF